MKKIKNKLASVTMIDIIGSVLLYSLEALILIEIMFHNIVLITF